MSSFCHYVLPSSSISAQARAVTGLSVRKVGHQRHLLKNWKAVHFHCLEDMCKNICSVAAEFLKQTSAASCSQLLFIWYDGPNEQVCIMQTVRGFGRSCGRIFRQVARSQNSYSWKKEMLSTFISHRCAGVHIHCAWCWCRCWCAKTSGEFEIFYVVVFEAFLQYAVCTSGHPAIWKREESSSRAKSKDFKELCECIHGHKGCTFRIDLFRPEACSWLTGKASKDWGFSCKSEDPQGTHVWLPPARL